ncbi:CinA domain protein [Candidatus Filomicrobium marinum]|uniref:CinA domain protein n=1 Tax=Candidatus Filomicrobium marinum TaxID=1608628 RepID=A0A0D6JAY2_9HYPH|nr:CinA family protein [Candidatus Filomicrobium marinum]CFX04447.1 CinA domain protein [Candidatus Filomicrobium marinum]CPR16055.1 CinA domain protein [Candidatus Filomicrobium marinum]
MKKRVPELPALAADLLAAAKRAGLTIATAESCTAGTLAAVLADAPGGGEQFHGGFVTYTKQSKIEILGVETDLIRKHSAVSQPVAEAMAKACLARSSASLAIAVTGVAGPEPDEDNNPVGEIHVAIAHRHSGTWHRKYEFQKRQRSAMREAILRAALIFAQQRCESVQLTNEVKHETPAS